MDSPFSSAPAGARWFRAGFRGRRRASAIAQSYGGQMPPANFRRPSGARLGQRKKFVSHPLTRPLRVCGDFAKVFLLQHLDTSQPVPRWFRWHSGWLGPLAAGLANPNGIPVASPGLSRQRDYPGQADAFLCNSNGVVSWGWAGQRAQPRWGGRSLRGVPKVARAAQPWAGGRNPVGIEAAIPQPLKWSARFACHRKQRGTSQPF